jgi:2-polyprenyl-3-methyl-5-hydroxy-6-metoxy-1,4-benzoquinol methylase
MSRKEHWENVYTTKSTTEVSWYQRVPSMSLSLIEAAGIGKKDAIIDVGGGASALIDCLLDRGFMDVSVLDIAASAIASARKRLGERAAKVHWYENDVTVFDLGVKFRLWHDRAVFHFLTEAKDRAAYLRNLDKHLAQDGHVMIATFSRNGPTKCSGLDIVQYDEESISRELGAAFRLRKSVTETHITPSNKEQEFKYFHFMRSAEA